MARATAGKPEAEASGKGDDNGGFSRWQIGRWVVALGVAVGAAAYYLLGIHNQILCQDALLGGTSVELCGPPGVGELVPFALLIGVLLAPDLSELGIIGLFSLKRTVENQAERQENLEAKLTFVEQRTDVSQYSNQALTLAVNIAGRQVDAKTVPEWTEQLSGDDGGKANEAVGLSDRGGDGAGERISGESEENRPRKRADRAGMTVVPEGEKRKAVLSQQILSLADVVSQYASAAQEWQANPKKRMTGFSEEEMERVDRWYYIFLEEIDLIREVRNVVLHHPFAIGGEELEEANRVARRVLRILFGGLGMETTLIDRLEEQLGTDGSKQAS